MNLTFLALIATTVSPSTGVPFGGNEPRENEWARFDADLERFVDQSAGAADGSMPVHGLLKAVWSHLPNSDPTGEDNSGLAIDRAQVGIGGQISRDTGFRLEIEGAGGTAVVLDAYGTWESCKYATFTFGQFRSPTVWESQLGDSDLLFILRTDTGELFYTRTRGAMVSGSLERFHWAAAVQNGLDGLEQDVAVSARASLDLLGGGVGLSQGTYDGGRDARLSVGAGYFDEQTEGNGKSGDVVVADAQFQLDRFAVDGMVGKYQDFAQAPFDVRSDSVPWNLAASFMVLEEKLEAAARFQDTDNVRHEKDLTLGVNYFLDGHAIKVQVNASYIFSDLDAIDDTVRFGVGATVRI
jgi:hypothetical protein